MAWIRFLGWELLNTVGTAKKERESIVKIPMALKKKNKKSNILYTEFIVVQSLCSLGRQDDSSYEQKLSYSSSVLWGKFINLFELNFFTFKMME